MDYAEMSKKMVEILGLRSEPVAITLIKKGQPYPAGYVEPETPIRHCQSIMRARHGEKLVVPAAKQACPVGGSALGLVPLPDKVKAGEFHHTMGMYETANAAAKTIADRPALETGSMIATAVAPLSKATIEPDVVVVTGMPEQVFWLLPAATTFSVGGRVTVEMAAVQASCADSTVVPYLTGNVNISLGCFGCRKTTDIKPEEMLVGIPAKKLPELVKNLEQMGAGPIPKSRAK
ncbi:MAG TPA: DUF169 domain-containing protein [Methanomassiliicoccales archaeon]|nr:DUF169 domain-containing protein [Methanomassiliicoccales archaeon]